MKKISKVLSIALIMVFVFSGCSKQEQVLNGTVNNLENNLPTQIYRDTYASELMSLNYLTSSNGAVSEFTALHVDGLVQYDKYRRVVPALATEWKESDDGLTWSFKLREGVMWYDNNGNEIAEVVADDFVASLEYALTKSNASRGSDTVSSVIKNAEEYYNEKITDFSQVGVKAVDKYTVEYTLINPCTYIISILSNQTFLPVNRDLLVKTGEKFATSKETLLSNGAYLIEEFDPESRRVLVYNPNYWDLGNIHIAKINQTYNKETGTIGPELFKRGETMLVTLPDAVLDEWMNDTEKADYVVRGQGKINGNPMIFNYAIPTFEKEYEPENWNKAVNNPNFRMSIMYALNRVSALTTLNPYSAENLLSNSLTCKDFLYINGTDYVEYGAMKEVSEKELFNPSLAVEYKNKAMEELKDNATFPIKVVYPYITNSLTKANMVQVIEQQLEKVLGKDFIDVIPTPFPSTNFNAEVRNAGQFGILDTSWGPDYEDPYTYASIWLSTTSVGKTRGSLFLAEGYKDTDGNYKYEKMVERANAEKSDIAKRYEMFAEAEAFLINEALVIPFYSNPYGFEITMLDPFEGFKDSKGLTMLKGRKILDKQLTKTMYQELQATYESEKEKINNN